MSLCVIVLNIFLFFTYTIVLKNNNLLDEKTIQYIGRLDSLRHQRLAIFFSFFGTGTFIIPIYILIITRLIFTNQKYLAKLVILLSLCSLLFGIVLKEIIRKPRPQLIHLDSAGGYSFPSGHTLGIFTLSGVLIYLLWREKVSGFLKISLSIFILIIAFFVGFSRIYLHVHFASDVIGSIIITMLLLSIFYILVCKLENPR